VSPRQPPTRHDATAQQFLTAAVRLIDSYLESHVRESQPGRLRTIRYPAALDWLRTEDVIRLAAASGKPGVSRKAFFNRWSTREEFLPDAVVYALDYVDVEDPNEYSRQLTKSAVGAAPLSDAVIAVCDGLLDSLMRHPRSFLTLHIGPLLPQHPKLWHELLPRMREGIHVWADGFAALLGELGIALRPGWTPQRLALALQAALDGFVLRYRILPDDYRESRWEGASLFADTVIAITIGAMDPDRSDQSGRAVLDQIAGRAP
jgi:AcrR family transcriptional regulator